VDGVGVIASVVAEGDSRRVTIRIPPELARFVAEKGSLAVDGTSLTVAACSSSSCEVAYIPHTLAHTVAGHYTPGRRVNLEVDLVARYVARLLSREGASFTRE
jgi:riboflavin synthase